MSGVRARLRALGEISGLVVRRRARRDIGLLISIVALIALATMLSTAGPRLVLETVDRGVRNNVAEAGSRADVSLLTPFNGTVRSLEFADGLRDRLPDGLSAVYAGHTLTVVSQDGSIRAVDGVEPPVGIDLRTRLGMLTPQSRTGLTLVDGRLPTDDIVEDTSPIEVVLSRASAESANATVGSLITIRLGASLLNDAAALTRVKVVGIVDAIDADAAYWQDLPELWSPLERPAKDGAQALTRFSVLTSPAGMDAIEAKVEGIIESRVRVALDSDSFTTTIASRVADELGGLSANSADLTGNGGGGLDVRTDLTRILNDYPIQARAALAQMSVMMAGVIGIAGIVLILLTRLLIVHRAGALALERARGASVASVGYRSLIESFVLTVVGTLVGVAVAQLVLPGDMRDPAPLVVVALVSLLAGPVQAMFLVRGAWTGRREPANRQDRAQLIRRGRNRRLVGELGIVALAAAALISLRNRGLLQTRTDGIDPFLAVALLLLAIAVTVVVVRIYPVPVRVAASLGRRSRGALGILGAVRAQQSLAVLPLLAITLGAALAVSGSLLVDTVRNGQEAASWERIGADVRIETDVEQSAIAALAAASHVDAVSGTISRSSVGIDLGTSTQSLDVVAIDESYPDLVDLLPKSPSTSSLRQLSKPVDIAEPLPVIVDTATARLLISDDISMYYGPKLVNLVVVGTTNVAPVGYLDGPFMFVDLEGLSARMPEPLVADTVLAVGSGAADAATHLGLPEDAVLTRVDWIDERRSLALIAGVERTMVAAVIAVGILAAIALVATVVSGARARGRALSMLRTLGMGPRLGWWLALSELAPMVIAAVIGGIAAGIAVVAALAPSLGLDVLAGGVSIPDASISGGVFAGLAIGAFALLLVGALADVLVHRRDKLSEVLRVGDTV